MTALGTEKGGHNYYCYVLSISDYSHVIFNNGSTGGVNSGNQTPDLPAKASARIDDNGRKYVVYYIYRDNGLMAASIGDDVWPNPMVTVEPTCTEPGYTRYEGLITGAVYGETTYEALGHLPGETEIENEIPATCTAPGSYDEVVYCQRCNAELTRTTVPTEQLDHVPGETVIENEVPATCTAPGGYDEVISCTLCGAQISRTHVETPQLPHTPGETVIENVDEQDVSRQQVATFLFRYLMNLDPENADRADLSAFPDAGEVSDFAKESMAWAVEAEIIHGMDVDGTLCLVPGASATRAEVSVMLMHFCRYLEQKGLAELNATVFQPMMR